MFSQSGNYIRTLDSGNLKALLNSVLSCWIFFQPQPRIFASSYLHKSLKLNSAEDLMKKEKMLKNLLIGTGVYLLESLRERAGDSFENISDRARDTYDEATRRASRAGDALRGNDSHVLGTTAALLIGVG